jgi:two-component system, OmpR family, phosphate regulon sensor histidine kinase PhoR
MAVDTAVRPVAEVTGDQLLQSACDIHACHRMRRSPTLLHEFYISIAGGGIGFSLRTEMKSERLGLVMIAASLVVIGMIIALLYWQQARLYRDKVRSQGVALTRALSGAKLSQLTAGFGEKNLVSTLTSVQGSDAFAYAVVVTKSGDKLFELTSPGSIVPAASMPSEPASWSGEHPLVSPGDGRKLREFFGPVLQGGDLAGFVRLGYYEAVQGVPMGDISYVALMALPIFLLTALSYFMIRQEIRPLARLTDKLEDLGKVYGIESGLRTGVDLRNLAHRFDEFMDVVQSKIRDVDRQRLEAETSSRLLSYKHEKVQAALDAIPDAVLVLDDSGLPSFVNPKLGVLLGLSPEAVMGQQPQKWCKHPQVLALLTRFNDLRALAAHTTAVEYAPEGQPERRISVSSYPLFSPRERSRLFGVLVVFRDVSEERLARQAGAEFVAQVSHELKTPLTTITTFSELLLGYAKLSDKDRVEAVNTIHSEVERATYLINNLLNISRLETGTLPIERQRVKIQDLLRDIVERMRKGGPARQVQVELKVASDLGFARLDKDLFRIAIDNLLNNAVKYSRPGGRVVLTAEKLSDSQMKINISDQGIGISPEDCERVFEKYYRSRNKEVTSRSGHGLGLYLAKRIVELHHGTISVHSELGKGTEFSIQFEAQPVRLEESAQA